MKRVSPLLSVLVLLCLTSVAGAESGAAWGVYGGDTANTRYSTLAKINTSNVQQLSVAWALQLGSVRSQESTPILVGDTLYVTSSSAPRTCSPSTPRRARALALLAGCSRRHRPVRVLRRQQPRCGTRQRQDLRRPARRVHGRARRQDRPGVWKTQVVDFTQGSVITSPPTIVKYLVITGFGGGEYGARGYLSALDQDTGKEVWRFWTVPGPGEPGNDTGRATRGNWRRHRLAHRLLRSGAQPALLRHQQSRRRGARRCAGRTAATTATHEPLLVHHARHQSRHRQDRVVLPETPYDAWDYDGVNEAVLVDVSSTAR